MGNFNMALLAAPAVVKDISSDIKAFPQKSSENEFSGVLAQEEVRAGEVNDDASVNQRKQGKSPVEHKEDKARKAAGSSGRKTVKKSESSDKAAEKRDDDVQETGANVFASVSVEDAAQENSVQVRQSTELGESSELQVLFAEMPEEVVSPESKIEIPDVGAASKIKVLNEETLATQNSLLIQDSGGKSNDEELLLSDLFSENESDSGALKLHKELPEGESTTKLFSADVAAESSAAPAAETEVKKVSEKLITANAKVEVPVGKSEKKKIEIVNNHQTEENTKIADAQKIVPDISIVAVATGPIDANSEKKAQYQGDAADRLSFQSGISLDKLSGEAEVIIESEVIVSDKKMQNKSGVFDQPAGNRFHSGSEVGTVHLQGRARENQPSLMQDGQGQKDSTVFTEGENSRSRAAFMDEMKSAVAEKTGAESALQSGTKDKPGLEVNFSKSALLPEMNSDFNSTAVVKKGADAVPSKPLPISDEHLLNQIQAGLTRPVNGRQTVTIKLWPEHLGRVDVKLVMHKQNLTATFMVDHPDVKDAMMRKVESLRDSLGLHGIDAKDISIKVAPAKSGDGPALMTDNQQHDNNSAWRQFNQGNPGNNGSGSQSGWSGNLDDEPLLSGAEIVEGISSMAESLAGSGSLHITA